GSEGSASVARLRSGSTRATRASALSVARAVGPASTARIRRAAIVSVVVARAAATAAAWSAAETPDANVTMYGLVGSGVVVGVASGVGSGVGSGAGAVVGSGAGAGVASGVGSAVGS